MSALKRKFSELTPEDIIRLNVIGRLYGRIGTYDANYLNGKQIITEKPRNSKAKSRKAQS